MAERRSGLLGYSVTRHGACTCRSENGRLTRAAAMIRAGGRGWQRVDPGKGATHERRAREADADAGAGG